MNEKTAVATADQAAQPPAPVQPKAPLTIGGSIAALIPQDIDQAFRLSTALARAGNMVPTQFQNKPDEIMAAMLRGMEVGLAPIQSLQWIAVINGRATIWGDAIPALLLKRGHFVDVALEGEGDDLTAVATVTRSDGRKIVRSFSMADAKRAGLAGKSGPWTQYPKRMLAHRARTFAARDGAPDALMGIEIAEEVMDHVGPENAKDVTPKTPKPGRAVYVDEARQEPPHDEDGVIPDETSEDAEIVETDEQRAARELHETADAKAGEGVIAFREWWGTLEPAARSEVAKRSVAYKEKAEKADAAKAPTDPFADSDNAAPDEGEVSGRQVNFETILRAIQHEMIGGNVAEEVRGMYQEELAAMKEQRPDLHAEAEKALAGAAA